MDRFPVEADRLRELALIPLDPGELREGCGGIRVRAERALDEMLRPPVVAPLARGEDGKTYNLNADTAAGALAESLGALKVMYLTDVEGLYRDLGDKDSLIARIIASIPSRFPTEIP